MGGFIVIIAALAALGIWYDAVRAREAANRVAVDACQRRSLQLLDGAVALAAWRPRLDRTGLWVERTYAFDYTSDGVGRARGFIIMLGQQIRHVVFEDGLPRAH